MGLSRATRAFWAQLCEQETSASSFPKPPSSTYMSRRDFASSRRASQNGRPSPPKVGRTVSPDCVTYRCRSARCSVQSSGEALRFLKSASLPSSGGSSRVKALGSKNPRRPCETCRASLNSGRGTLYVCAGGDQVLQEAKTMTSICHPSP